MICKFSIQPSPPFLLLYHKSTVLSIRLHWMKNRTDDSCIPQSGILPGEEMFACPCAKSRKSTKLTPSGKLTVSLRSKR